MEEAERYNREVLDIQSHTLGDEHPETLHTIHNMGMFMERQGKLEEAERFYNEALEGRVDLERKEVLLPAK